MKKVIFIALLAILSVIAVISCKNNKTDIYGEDVVVDESGIEMTFKEINEDGDVIVEIANHMKSDLQEFYARAIWLDESGNTFEGWGGEPDDMPFQQIDKNMILSGKKDDFKTMLNIERAPEGTKSVEFKIIYAKFEDKSEWRPEE
ncbi:MAG: hypothetical protein JXR36_08485 [Bacteroidales bacterium]|nr:hypothetical protein [Bacteroidales bacterium]